MAYMLEQLNGHASDSTLAGSNLSNDMLRRGVIEVFARNSAVLEMLPFMEIAGNSFKYNQEATLPGIAFRGVNGAYEESAGVINQLSEGLFILGGDVDVDKFVVQTRGNVNDIRAIQTEMKAKALSLAFTRQFFKGDSAVEVNGFDGLQKRVSGAQVINGGATTATALTIELLDELIDAVEGEPDVLFVSKPMRRKIKSMLQQNNAYQESVLDAFGRPVMSYGGIQIRTIETDETGAEILGFNEAVGDGVGANGTTGSIYAVKFGADQYVSGLRNGGVDVRDLGELETKPAYRTRIEFYAGLAVMHPKAVARLKGIAK
jgi:hypothetical protein